MVSHSQTDSSVNCEPSKQITAGYCQCLATYDSSLCSCRALVYAIGETLWRAGGSKKATVAMLDIPAIYIDRNFKEEEEDEVRKAC